MWSSQYRRKNKVLGPVDFSGSSRPGQGGGTGQRGCQCSVVVAAAFQRQRQQYLVRIRAGGGWKFVLEWKKSHYVEGVINTKLSLAAFHPSGLIGRAVERSVGKVRPSCGGVFTPCTPETTVSAPVCVYRPRVSSTTPELNEAEIFHFNGCITMPTSQVRCQT